MWNSLNMALGKRCKKRNGVGINQVGCGGVCEKGFFSSGCALTEGIRVPHWGRGRKSGAWSLGDQDCQVYSTPTVQGSCTSETYRVIGNGKCVSVVKTSEYNTFIWCCF